jgi:hypothetical protein
VVELLLLAQDAMVVLAVVVAVLLHLRVVLVHKAITAAQLLQRKAAVAVAAELQADSLTAAQDTFLQLQVLRSPMQAVAVALELLQLAQVVQAVAVTEQ